MLCARDERHVWKFSCSTFNRLFGSVRRTSYSFKPIKKFSLSFKKNPSLKDYKRDCIEILTFSYFCSCNISLALCSAYVCGFRGACDYFGFPGVCWYFVAVKKIWFCSLWSVTSGLQTPSPLALRHGPRILNWWQANDSAAREAFACTHPLPSMRLGRLKVPYLKFMLWTDRDSNLTYQHLWRMLCSLGLPWFTKLFNQVKHI